MLPFFYKQLTKTTMSQFNEDDFFSAIDLICEEKKLPKDKVIETIEAALAVAYRKDYGRPQMEIKAVMGLGGLNDVSFFIVKEVIDDQEEIKDELTQMSFKDAKKIDKEIEIGGKVKISAPAPEDFGRIAAQTAKQVIVQRLREAERENVFIEFKDKENSIISGVVQRIEGQNIYVDLGPAIGVILQTGRVPGEHYNNGQRLRLYLEKVENTPKGAQIVLSRSNSDFIKKLFTIEIPEIELGSVEIKSVAREPGVRTKIAVYAKQEGVDPIGSCVGQKGTRVQAIINEIGDEKIDIVLWHENPITFIKNSLAPAKIAKVATDETKKIATIYVEPEQQSLAIGRNGQNVKLASRLTGWKLDIIEASKEVLAKVKNEEEIINEKTLESDKSDEQSIINETKDNKKEQSDGLSKLSTGEKIKENLRNAGYDNLTKIASATLDELLKVEGIGKITAGKLHKQAKESI